MPGDDAVYKVVMEAVGALAQTDWDAESIVCEIEKVREGTENTKGPTEALNLLASTKMEPEQIAATVFFVRDKHHQGVPLKFYGPPGLAGVALFDFVYDKKTKAMEAVSFPEDIAHLFPLSALLIAIRLKYVRTEPGVWKDRINL
jgi:hypothetical protein